MAAAEMAMAGRLGVSLDASAVGGESGELSAAAKLFAESNTRFLIEVTPEREAAVAKLFAEANVPLRKLGQVEANDRVRITLDGKPVIDAEIDSLLQRWKNPLNW